MVGVRTAVNGKRGQRTLPRFLKCSLTPFCYQDLTGWTAPVAGGPTANDLTPVQKALDRQARLTISRELGHEREQITAVYLGR